MHRFFVAPELLQQTNNNISLPKDLAHQVRDVLHLQPGEQLTLLDNSGDEGVATIVATGKTGVDVRLLERRAGKSESNVRIILCQGLLKSARFEWVLEKGTELGVAVFSPILCRRSMAGLEDAGASKLQRWQRIIQEAAEQSGRARLPQLLPIRPLIHALNDIPAGAIALMPWEEERTITLRDVLEGRGRPQGSPPLQSGFPQDADSSVPPRATARVPAPPHPTPALTMTDDVEAPRSHGKGGGGADVGRGPLRSPWGDSHTGPQRLSQQDQVTVVLFIGPEGGLMAEEVELAQRYGAQAVTLGPRILRAETAALVAVANVMYELER